MTKREAKAIDEDGGERRADWNAVCVCVDGFHLVAKDNYNCQLFFLSFSSVSTFQGECDMRHPKQIPNKLSSGCATYEITESSPLTEGGAAVDNRLPAGVRCVCAICSHNLIRFRVTSIGRRAHVTVKV